MKPRPVLSRGSFPTFQPYSNLPTQTEFPIEATPLANLRSVENRTSGLKTTMCGIMFN